MFRNSRSQVTDYVNGLEEPRIHSRITSAEDEPTTTPGKGDGLEGDKRAQWRQR